MKLVNQSAALVCQEGGVNGIYRKIEACARTCYKSEKQVTDETAQRMFEQLTKSGHLSPLEHGIVYLKIPYMGLRSLQSHYNKGSESFRGLTDYINNPYSKVVATCDADDMIYITTNLRVLYENGWMDDLKYLCEPTENHVKAYTVRCVTDRGVSHELVRHRVFSFAQESTRYKTIAA